MFHVSYYLIVQLKGTFVGVQFNGELLKISRHKMASTSFIAHGRAMRLQAGNNNAKKAAYNKTHELGFHLD